MMLGSRWSDLGGDIQVRSVALAAAGMQESGRMLDWTSFPGPFGVPQEGRIPNLALCLQIRLIPNQHNGEVVAVLDSEDLSEEFAHLVETGREAREWSPARLVPPIHPPSRTDVPLVTSLTFAGR